MEKKVVVFKEEGLYGFPSNLEDFIAFWGEKRDLVPEQYKSKASIDIDMEIIPYSETDMAVFKVSYLREETTEEKAERLELEKVAAEAKRILELGMLKRLQKKYAEG